MKVKLFYKNQKELANTLNIIINQYHSNEIDEVTLKDLVISILKNNESMVFKDNTYTTTIAQRCGKRRLELIDKIRNQI